MKDEKIYKRVNLSSVLHKLVFSLLAAVFFGLLAHSILAGLIFMCFPLAQFLFESLCDKHTKLNISVPIYVLCSMVICLLMSYQFWKYDSFFILYIVLPSLMFLGQILKLRTIKPPIFVINGTYTVDRLRGYQKQVSLKLFRILMWLIAIVSFYIIGVLIIMSGPDINTPKYYSDLSVYEEIECEASFDDGRASFNIIGEVSHPNMLLNGFSFRGTSLEIVTENGFFDDIQEGEIVYIESSPGIFGDGYRRPIVSLRTDTKTYLEFEPGLEILIDDCVSAKNFFLYHMALAVCSLVGSSFAIVKVQKVIDKHTGEKPEDQLNS
jgi:hypothetical protein